MEAAALAPHPMHRRRFRLPPLRCQERGSVKEIKEKNMKAIAVSLVVIGSVLFGLGMSMRVKQNAFTRMETEVIKGDQGKKAAIGAVAGAAVGAGAGATVGGVGVVLCGTGFGIPAGAVCLGVAGICSLIGGGVGALAGTPDETIAKPITDLVNAYSPIEYWTVLVVGALLIGIGMFLFLRAKKIAVCAESQKSGVSD